MGEARSTRGIGGTTSVVGVIGWPVSSSLSPAIHNAAFDALEMDWVYVPLPVVAGGLPGALAGLQALGFVGANVTMPHKTRSAELIATLSDDARRLRAVNTIVVRPEGLEGHNTDGPGFERFLTRDAGFDAAGRTALLFGGGGAARACALALARSGIDALTVALRDPARGEGIRAAVEGFDVDLELIPLAAAIGARADLIVNATPVGPRGDRLPLPPLERGIVVVDLTYPAITPLIEQARAAGAAAFGGIGLLLQQAGLSFELWTGLEPPMPAMSAAAVARLSEPTV